MSFPFLPVSEVKDRDTDYSITAWPSLLRLLVCCWILHHIITLLSAEASIEKYSVRTKCAVYWMDSDGARTSVNSCHVIQQLIQHLYPHCQRNTGQVRSYALCTNNRTLMQPPKPLGWKCPIRMQELDQQSQAKGTAGPAHRVKYGLVYICALLAY